MTTRSYEPPWEFLLSASKNSLQNFELSRLSNAANLRKEIGALVDQWLADQASATVARLLLEERERTARLSEGASPAENAEPEPCSASDNFFADRSVAKHCNGGKH
jgi:hypothetical protein